MQKTRGNTSQSPPPPPPPPKVTKLKGKEIWWNAFINLPIKVGHNRPDITIWDYDSKVFSLVEVCAPLDMNVTNKTVHPASLWNVKNIP